MIKKLSSIILFQLIVCCSKAQEYIPFRQIKRFTAQQAPSKYDSSISFLTSRLGAELHYLYPFYQALNWEVKYKEKAGEAVFYNSFAESLAFAGDYSMANIYTTKAFMPLPDSVLRDIKKQVEELGGIQAVPASTSIIDIAKHYKTVMINESHSSGQQRAFTYGLLSDLYKLGFRYLAMEALNNYANKNLDSLNVFTGYYTCEPVMGEMVRHALNIGYKLISYEDTLSYLHTDPSVRDSVQAANIYKSIKHDSAAKVLIHAGYAHISREKLGDYTPMAIWFSKLTGEIPFTIDQTEMAPGGHHEYGRLFYHYFNEKYNITEASFIFQNKRPFNPSGLTGYDAIVFHPPAKNIQNRPGWLTFNNERQPVLIAPSEKNLFLVQAYYEPEYSEQLRNYIVPADQTYIAAPTGYYCLFLKKGNYKLILRDAGYKVLAEKELIVK